MRRTAWLAWLASFSIVSFAQWNGGFGGTSGGHAGAAMSGRAGAARGAGFSRPSPGARSSGAAVSPARIGPAGVAYTPNIYGSVSGFGNVVFPGTGHAPGAYNPFTIVGPGFGANLANTVVSPGFGASLGSTVGGFSTGRGFRRFGRSSSTTVIVPYAVPVYVPAYPYAEPNAGYVDANAVPPDTQVGAAYPPVAPPQVIYVVPSQPPQPQAPSSGGVVTYVVPPRDNAGGQPSTGVTVTAPPNGISRPIYLIALKNNTIYSATECWVEDDTLHYVTPEGAHNQVSLDQVDVDFTTRLNRERGIEFRLQQ